MKLWVGHEYGTHTHGQGKLYMPFRHFMAGHKKKISLNYHKSAAMGFLFQGTQEPVRNSRGKRAISVRATEGLLY